MFCNYNSVSFTLYFYILRIFKIYKTVDKVAKHITYTAYLYRYIYTHTPILIPHQKYLQAKRNKLKIKISYCSLQYENIITLICRGWNPVAHIEYILVFIF